MRNINSAMKSLILFLIVITMAFFVTETEAKRGCASFGHSCYGGHGKRRDLSSGFGGDLGQEEVAVPKPTYPRTIRELIDAGDDIIPVRNGGFQEMNEEPKISLTPSLKHWLLELGKLHQQQNPDLY